MRLAEFKFPPFSELIAVPIGRAKQNIYWESHTAYKFTIENAKDDFVAEGELFTFLFSFFYLYREQTIIIIWIHKNSTLLPCHAW